MFEIKNWCFLCGSDKDVSVEICGLAESVRELIGTFTIINCELVSSQICKDCYNFLLEYERRKELYGRVEAMYMEILKLRSKPSVNVRQIRAKHQIDHETPEKLKSPPADHQQPLINIVHFEINEVEVEEFIEADTVQEQSEDQTRALRPSKGTPKLLNPTIVPKQSDNPTFECDLCSFSSSTKASLAGHISRAHKPSGSNVKQKFSCPECNKSLSSQSALTCHLRSIHKQLKNFQCSSCSKTFATKGTCKEHEKTHFPDKNLACPICDKAFKTLSILTHHIDTHGNSNYSCPECGKKLNTKRTLKMHLLTHSSVTKFACQFCKSQFKRAKDYKEHLMAVHTKLRPYTCSWCDKTFSNGPNSRKHKRDHHPVELKEAEKRGVKEKVVLPTIEELIKMIEK